MNSSTSIFRLLVAAATVGLLLLFGAGGATAAPGLAAGPLVAENHDDNSDEENSEDNSDEENSDEDNSDEDNSDEDNSDEDNSDEDSSDEPTDEPTFTELPPTDPTDVTEMPTPDAEPAAAETGASPLGWILLGGGVACAAAAIAVYRRNRNIM